MSDEESGYLGPERRRGLRELRDATDRLGTQVESLSGALSAIADLQVRQTATERLAREAKESAHDQHALSEHIVTELGTKPSRDDVRETFLKSAVLLLLTALLLTAMGFYVYRETSRITKDEHRSCVVRNSLLSSVIKREQTLAEIDPANVRALHLKSADEARALLTGC